MRPGEVAFPVRLFKFQDEADIARKLGGKRVLGRFGSYHRLEGLKVRLIGFTVWDLICT